MHITRALIGRNLGLDQAIQTRKFKVPSRLRKARKITRLRLVFRALFLTLATFPACLDQAIQTEAETIK